MPRSHDRWSSPATPTTCSGFDHHPLLRELLTWCGRPLPLAPRLGGSTQWPRPLVGVTVLCTGWAARPRSQAGFTPPSPGYDVLMSESSSEKDQTSDGGKGITDDQLPDDLNPEKNPLARDPEDTDEAGGAPAGGS